MGRFVLLKYVSLATNAARALLLAALLGPASYGMLGTLVAVQQYLSYAALGVREGLTVRLAQPAATREPNDQIHISALAWGLGVGLVVILCSQAWAAIATAPAAPWLWVGIVAALSILNEILINIARDRNELVRIALLDLTYNLSPLLTALILWDRVSVTIVLESLALGLVLSIIGYLRALTGLRWTASRKRTIATLLRYGIPLAISSFFSTTVTSIFIFLANAMKAAESVGLVVFGNNLCTIVLFGANSVAWAATSKSMRRLSGAHASEPRSARIAMFFRGAVVIAALLLASCGFVFQRLLPAYAGAERYAVLLCLLQSHGLLLYSEINFLAVQGRGRLIVAGYASVVCLTATAYALLPHIPLAALIGVAIAASSVLALACLALCRRLGLAGEEHSERLFVLFPAACAGAYLTSGQVAAQAVALAYLALWAAHHRRTLRMAWR